MLITLKNVTDVKNVKNVKNSILNTVLVVLCFITTSRPLFVVLGKSNALFSIKPPFK